MTFTESTTEPAVREPANERESLHNHQLIGGCLTLGMARSDRVETH